MMNRKLIMQLALPIFIESALMMVDSIIHVIWVGQLLGGLAVAAIGACFPLILTLAALGSSTARAAATPLLQQYQSKQRDGLQKAVNVSWSSAVFTIVLVTAVGFFSSPWLLRLLGTPDDVLVQATGYLRIMVLGFVVMYLSFLTVAVLRGVGKTLARMIFVIISMVGNLVLVPLFIVGAGPLPRMELYGAAVASLLVSVIAIVVCYVYLSVNFRDLLLRPTRWLLDREAMQTLMPIGMPVFVQQFLLALGYACIIVFVNPFGGDATAALYITSRLDSIAALPAIAVMIAVSIVVQKQLAAGKPGAIGNIFKWGLVVNLPVVVLISILCFAAPRGIMELFVGSEAIVGIGADYFRIISAGYLLFTVLYVCNGIILGVGKAGAMLAISLASLVLVRIPLSIILVHAGYGVSGVWWAVLASFVAIAALTLLYYASGAWKAKPSAKDAGPLNAVKS